jgi:hypothetical protein
MKRVNLLFVVLLGTIILGFSGTASAQRWDWNSNSAEVQFRDFSVFLHDHPWIARKLWEKPLRVNDRGFLNGNKELEQWLDDHPVAASAFHEDPIGFMERERHFEIYGADFSAGPGIRSALARFDWFLDGHPDIRRDLMRRPQLALDSRYLDYHPELRDYLYRHPDVTTELNEHPREFMRREARYERGA